MRINAYIFTILSCLVLMQCTIVNDGPGGEPGGSITGATVIPNNTAKYAAVIEEDYRAVTLRQYPIEVYLYDTRDLQELVQTATIDAEGIFTFDSLEFGTYDIVTNIEKTGFIFRNIVLTPENANIVLDSILFKNILNVTLILDSTGIESVYFYDQPLEFDTSGNFIHRYLEYGVTPVDAYSQYLTIMRGGTIEHFVATDSTTLPIELEYNLGPVPDTNAVDSIIGINTVSTIDTSGDTTHTNVIYTWIVDRDGGATDTNYIHSDSLVKTPDWESVPMNIVYRYSDVVYDNEPMQSGQMPQSEEPPPELVYINYTDKALYPYARNFYHQRGNPQFILIELNTIIADTKGSLSKVITDKISILEKPDWATVTTVYPEANACSGSGGFSISESKCGEMPEYQTHRVNKDASYICTLSGVGGTNVAPMHYYRDYDTRLVISWDTYEEGMSSDWVIERENAYGNKDTLAFTSKLRPDSCYGGTLELDDDTLYSWIVDHGALPTDTNYALARSLYAPLNFDTIPVSVKIKNSYYYAFNPDTLRVIHTYTDTIFDDVDTLYVNYNGGLYENIDFEYLAFDTTKFKSDLSTIRANSMGFGSFTIIGLDTILKKPDWITINNVLIGTEFCGYGNSIEVNYEEATCTEPETINMIPTKDYDCFPWEYYRSFYFDVTDLVEFTFNTCSFESEDAWVIVVQNGYGNRDTVEVVTRLMDLDKEGLD